MKTPVTLTDQGCDRSTAYHQANKIVRTAQGVFVTWLDSQYRCVLAHINEEGNVLEQYPFAQAHDNHCGAAMTLTPDGVLHVVSGSHGMGFLYRQSATPWDSNSWSLPQVVGQTATYPCLVHTSDGVLHLAHRRGGLAADEHWGICWHMTSLGKPWGLQKGLFWRMPAPLYSFPTNSMAVAADGTLHMVMEWYKTWPNSVEPAHSLGVSHFELPPGTGGGALPQANAWRHTDGREVKQFPITMEASQPLAYTSPHNPRPGNVAILTDGRPVFGCWNSDKGTAFLLVQQTNKTWRAFDLTEPMASRDGGKYFCSQPQIAVNHHGQIVAVVARANDVQWGSLSSQLHVLVIDPQTDEILRHEAIVKLKPDEPDWLASLEKPGPGIYPESFHLIYQTGRRGEGCVNHFRCCVNHVVVS